MASRSADRLLKALGDDLGIAGLGLDGEGRCTLTFDGIGVTFELDQPGDQLFLYAGLGALPDGAPAALLERLLGANLFWRGTGGATLSLDPDSRRVVLAQAVPVSGSSEIAFQAVVERFVSAAEAWTGRVGKEADESVERAPMPHSGMFV